MNEFLPELLKAFHDRFENDGRDDPIIKCKICCLEAPAASTRAEICEMCYEDDFWDWVQSMKQSS